MCIFRRLPALTIALGLLLGIAQPASSQTYTWSASSSAAIWGDSTSWTPGTIPNANGVTARFTGATGTTIYVDGTYRLGRLTIERLAEQGYYSISPASETASLIFNNGASTDSVIESLPGVGAGIEFYLNSPIVIGGNRVLQINNSTISPMQISDMSGSGGTGASVVINAAGQNGVVTLSGVNTYGGGTSTTTVAGGTLRSTEASDATEGKGIPANSTLILNGGVFEIADENNYEVSFNRSLGSGLQNVRLIGGGTTRAGFSVYEGTLTINLNNNASVLTWGAVSFNPGVLVLGTASASENNVVIFENGINLGGSVRTISAETFGFNNSSYSQINGVLSNGGLTKQGDGILELTATNTYTGRTTILAGVLRADSGAGIHANSPITINGGILESRGASTFTRSLGTGAGQIEIINGGFSAYGSNLEIRLNNSTTAVTWGAGSFVTGGNLRLGSTSSDSMVNFRNGIDLNGGTRTIEVDGNPSSPSALARLSGTISNGSLTIDGNGVALLEMTGTNNYVGETRVREAVLRANSGVGLPTSSPLFLDAGGILEGIGNGTFTRNLGNGAGQVRLGGSSSGFSASGGAMTIQLNGGTGPVTWGDTNFLPTNGSLVLGSLSSNNLVDFQNALDLGGGTRTISVYDNQFSTNERARVSGVISNGSLTKDLSGILELTAVNTYTGETKIVGGTLRATDGVGLPAASHLLIDNTAVLESFGNATFSRSLGGDAGQFQIGTGGGGFSAASGTMNVQINGGTGPVVWGSEHFIPGDALLVLGSSVSTGTVNFQNSLDLDEGLRQILVNGGVGRISGVISRGGLEIFGPGTFELTAANTYSFGTNVWQGKLLANNTTGSATGTGYVNVQFGATLAGGGKIAGAESFTAGFGSRVEPGGTAGNTLTISTQAGGTITIDGTWAIRINTAGTSGVTINSGGSSSGTLPNPANHTFLDLNASGGVDIGTGTDTIWEINGTGATFVSNQRYSYVIGRAGAGQVAVASITDQARFKTVGFTARDISLSTLANGNIVLNFTPVPEPATILGLAAAGIGLLGLKRRRT